MNTRLALTTGVLLLLAGCSLSPPYQRPQAPVPGTWPSGPAYDRPAAAVDAPVPARLSWRAFFTDRRLVQVIAGALENNRDLRVAALEVQRARALYGVQRAALYPAVDGTLSGSRQRMPADLSSSGEAGTQERYDVNLGTAGWEIDFFGRLRSLRDRALQAYLATDEARRSLRILIVSEVARAYLTLAADTENLQLARKTLETQGEAHYIMKRRFEVGIATELDLYRSKIQVDSARRDVALYTQLTALDRNALELLAGAPVPDALVPTTLGTEAFCGEASAGLSSEILLLRPDILAAEHRLKTADADIAAARAALFPRITLTAAAGTASAELAGLFDAGSGTWLFAPRVVLPIFDTRLWSALKVTRTGRELAVAQYERAVQTAFREVADALAVRGTMEEQVAAQRAVVEAARESHRLSRVRYERGLDSYLGVLDAQRSLYEARRVLTALVLRQQVNRTRLYAVLGGGAL